MDRRNGAAAQRLSVHDARIELDLADSVQMGAASGIEGLVVLHKTNHLLDGIDRRSALLQQIPPDAEGRGAPFPVGIDQTFRNIPGASVNDK